VLLLATLFLWVEGPRRYPLALQLIPVAAIAAPLIGRRRSAWCDATAMLPPLLLIGVSLYVVTDPSPPQAPGFELTFVGLVLTVCAGLVVRVIGEALTAQVDPTTPPSRLFDALYLLFTLMMGSNALLTLWQRGGIWQGNGTELGLAGVWLAWSGAWLSPHHRPRLRAAFIAVAALLLAPVVLAKT
jgi:hypothetical protein